MIFNFLFNNAKNQFSARIKNIFPQRKTFLLLPFLCVADKEK